MSETRIEKFIRMRRLLWVLDFLSIYEVNIEIDFKRNRIKAYSNRKNKSVILCPVNSEGFCINHSEIKNLYDLRTELKEMQWRRK